MACQPTSQQYCSLILNQHQPPATSQSAVLFSHNKSTPVISHSQANTAIIKCDASRTHNYLIQFFLHIRLVWRWLVTKIVIPASQGSNRGCTKKKSPCRASLKKCGRVPACANSAVQPWSYWQWAPAKDCQHCQGSIFLNKHLTIRINKLLLALFVYRISKN